MSLLSGRRILVTGGSRGIGAATVRAATGLGAHCAFIARGHDAARRVSADTGAIAIHADLAVPDQAAAAVRGAVDSLHGLDCLINNAGSFRLGNVSDGSYQDWRDMVDVNVMGLLTTSQACIPYLEQSECGQIINVSSLSGRRVSGATSGVYAGTKHAVHAMSEGLRHELHGKNVRVTVVAPGVVRTNYGEYITDPEVRAVAKADQEDWGLDPASVANQIMHVLAAPADIYLIEIAFMSTRQPPG